MTSPTTTQYNRCQYGEETILEPFFRRTVVDVGAADGVTFSNSRLLLQQGGWQGILIEPEPRQFKLLQQLYANDWNVRCYNYAVAEEGTERTMYPGKEGLDLMGSTLVTDRIGQHGMKHREPIQVKCMPLRTILAAAECPSVIDFLTIDAEGMDLEVLQSMGDGWHMYDVRLICVESGSDGTADDPLNNYLKSLGFEYHAHTKGNTFWKPAIVHLGDW